jgi:Xaa-Pro dipeptidase
MLQERLIRLQKELRDRGLDCLALIPGANLRYMTGLDFHLMERPLMGFFPAEGQPVFAIPELERPKFERDDLYPIHLFPYTDTEGPASAFEQAIMALPEVQSLSVEYLRMRVMELKLVQRHLPNATLSDARPVMDVLRLRKDPSEIALMQEAVRITEQALRHLIEQVRPGMTERQIASRLSVALLEAGGEAIPIEPIVLSGPNAAMPHGIPGNREVQAGEVLLLDFGTSVGGYLSDITRTFVVGRQPDSRLREIYEVVKEANAAGRAAAAPGVPCQEVDRAARQVIEAAGWGRHFIHRTGHGIGLEGHEGPYMVEGNTELLEAGMSFTVEPGIYLSGEFGIRIEDDMVITPDGSESLTSFERNLMVIATSA